MMRTNLRRRLTAEATGTAMLLATIVGSGIMAERLAGGNVAIALLGNTIPTGAMLTVLILIFAPISGAHFNPAVTLAFTLRRDLTPVHAWAYAGAQLSGAVAGVWLAHLMFEQDVIQLAARERSGLSQWLSEAVATFGLVLTILACLRWREKVVAAAVGLYITAAYWFTASTGFANPAVTVGRTLTDSFSGIHPADMPAFVGSQIIGALAATWLVGFLTRE